MRAEHEMRRHLQGRIACLHSGHARSARGGEAARSGAAQSVLAPLSVCMCKGLCHNGRGGWTGLACAGRRAVVLLHCNGEAPLQRRGIMRVRRKRRRSIPGGGRGGCGRVAHRVASQASSSAAVRYLVPEMRDGLRRCHTGCGRSRQGACGMATPAYRGLVSSSAPRELASHQTGQAHPSWQRSISTVKRDAAAEAIGHLCHGAST